jgi:hypothetical protein
MAQNLRYARRGQLTRSTRAGRVVDQALLTAKKQHGICSLLQTTFSYICIVDYRRHVVISSRAEDVDVDVGWDESM